MMQSIAQPGAIKRKNNCSASFQSCISKGSDDKILSALIIQKLSIQTVIRLEGKHYADVSWDVLIDEPSHLDLQCLHNSAIVVFGVLWVEKIY